jgi:hypothetical protein
MKYAIVAAVILLAVLIVYLAFVNYWICQNGKCVKKFWGGKYFSKGKCAKKCKQVSFRHTVDAIYPSETQIDRQNPDFVFVS